MAVSVMDHVLDTVSGVMQGSVASVQACSTACAATSRGERPHGVPPGTQSGQVGAGGSDVALERVIASAREAKATAQQVTRDARSAATRTAKAARGAG